MTALVVGSSETAFDEVISLNSFFDNTPVTVFCVNLTGSFWKWSEFNWVTLHPELLADYEKIRKTANLPDCYRTIGPLESECDIRLPYLWDDQIDSGSSGLFAVKAALDTGHDRVICAGVPMEPRAGHFHRRSVWDQCLGFRRGWEQSLPHIEAKVRSISGWTKDLLGAPTPEWLGQS